MIGVEIEKNKKIKKNNQNKVITVIKKIVCKKTSLHRIFISRLALCFIDTSLKLLALLIMCIGC